MTLEELRPLVLAELDPVEWRSASTVCQRLGVGAGLHWYRVSMILYRAAVNGEAEVRGAGSRHRHRRPQEPRP